MTDKSEIGRLRAAIDGADAIVRAFGKVKAAENPSQMLGELA
jgi:hypothetical protein